MEDAQPTTLEPPVEQPLDPLVAIWLAPRATVRRLVDRPEHQGMLLAALGGVYGALVGAQANDVGDQGAPLLMLGLAIGLGAAGGLFLLYGGARLIEWIGGRLGGTANGKEIRTTLAWATVPLLAGLALFAVQLPLYGEELFLSSTPRIDAHAWLQFGLVIFIVLRLVTGGWGVVIVVVALAEVQGFSVGRALVSLLLAVLALAVLAGLLAGPVMLLVR